MDWLMALKERNR